MKLFSALLCVAAVLCLSVPSRAQDITNLYAAGVSYNPGASQQVAGSALYAHEVNTSGTYAFTHLDVLPNSVHPFTVNTNIGVGVAQKIATIAGAPIFVPTAAGISFNGQNTGWAWTTGAAVPIKIQKSKSWYVVPTVRVLKSSVSGGSGYQPIIGVLFGWGQ